MQHPNIMTAYTTGTDNGAPFMVLEYLEGSDLSKAVARSADRPTAVLGPAPGHLAAISKQAHRAGATGFFYRAVGVPTRRRAPPNGCPSRR